MVRAEIIDIEDETSCGSCGEEDADELISFTVDRKKHGPMCFACMGDIVAREMWCALDRKMKCLGRS